jgi:ABC-type multidrug transport system fused ATPase/permease subunit
MTRLLDHIRFFAGFTGWQLVLLIAFTIATGVLDTVGLTMFLPLLEIGMSGAVGDSKVTRSVAEVFAFLGLPLSFEPVLLLVVVIFGLKGVMGFGFRTAMAAIQLDVQEGMRLHLVERTKDTAYQHWIGQKPGLINNILVREIDMANKNLKACVTLIETGIMVSIFIATVFWVRPLVGAVCLAFAGLIFVIFRQINTSSGSLSIATTEESGAIQRLALQIFQNFKYLKGTAAFGPLSRHLRARIGVRRRHILRLQIYTSLIRSAAEPIAVIVVAGFVLVMTRHAQLALSTAILPILLLYRALGKIQEMNAAWNMFMQSTGAVRAYRAAVDDLAAHAEVAEGEPVPALERAVTLDNVSLSYPGGAQQALRSVSMVIPVGQRIGVVGETGAGKTTLIDVLTGLMPPTSGKVLWDDQDYAGLDTASLRARIGYVTQEPVIFDDTIGNNITGWRPYRDAEGNILPEVIAASRAAQIHDVVEATEDGFDTVLGERGTRLSGGQRQRVAIARELFRKPDLLVFDEGTSSLDVETETALVETLQGLAHEWTVVIVAHRFATIRDCDKIYVLGAGRVVGSGTWDDLASRRESWFARAAGLQATH